MGLPHCCKSVDVDCNVTSKLCRTRNEGHDMSKKYVMWTGVTRYEVSRSLDGKE